MRSDYDPKAVQRALVREGLSYLAHAVLTPFGFLKSRHKSVRSKDIRTVVFVHGYAANRAGFFPLQTYLKLRGLSRHYAYNYKSVGSIEAAAVRLKKEIDDNVKGGRIDLIAHSLGGIVARLYIQQLGGDRRVDRLVTIGTPHLGTEAYVYVPTALISQLRPGGPLLQHLNSLPVPERLRCISVASGRDVMVIPRENAFCPFGETQMFDDLGHTGLLLSPAVFEFVHSALVKD